MSAPETNPDVTVPAMPDVEVPDVSVDVPSMPTVEVPVPSIPDLSVPDQVAPVAVDSGAIPSVNLSQYAASDQPGLAVAPDPYNIYSQPAPMPAPDPYAAYGQPAPAPSAYAAYGQPAPAPDPYAAYGAPAPAPDPYAAYGAPAVSPAPVYGVAPSAYNAPAYVMAPTITTPMNNSLGIAAMSCGIASLVFMWVPVLGLLAGIAGIVLGVMSMGACNKGLADNKGMAIAGIVCGAVGTFFSLLINIAYLFAVTQS